MILLKSALERSERKKQDREESAFSYGIRETIKKRENSKRLFQGIRFFSWYSNWLHQRTRAKKTFHAQ